MKAILVNFNNNTEYESVAKKAHDRLYFYLNRAHFALKGSEVRSEREQSRFETWFGKINEAHLNSVRNVIKTMHDAFEDNNIEIHYGGDSCDMETYAYVEQDDIESKRYIIHLCGLFFKIKDNAKFDTAMGTIVHELSHLAAGTVDFPLGEDEFCYGQEECLKLANSKPDAAVTNADNYQFYCESFIK